MLGTETGHWRRDKASQRAEWTPRIATIVSTMSVLQTVEAPKRVSANIHTMPMSEASETPAEQPSWTFTVLFIQESKDMN
jgi:hypothetical protein